MRFSKIDNMYRVTRVTGSQDNILGIVFSENDSEISSESKEELALIEWKVKDGAVVKTSGEQVLEQVLSGLKKANAELGKNYKLAEIHFLPSDSAKNSVYEQLVLALIQHYDTGSEFREIAS